MEGFLRTTERLCLERRKSSCSNIARQIFRGLARPSFGHRNRSKRRDDANSSITSESPLLVDHYSRTCVRVAGLAMNLYSRGVNEGANRGRPHTSDFPQPQLRERGLGKAGGVPAFVFFPAGTNLPLYFPCRDLMRWKCRAGVYVNSTSDGQPSDNTCCKWGNGSVRPYREYVNPRARNDCDSVGE